jgi:hypothetical protein
MVPHREVVVLEDPASPLFYLRCARPCTPEGWCQRHPFDKSKPGICWLGSALAPEGAALIASWAGYTVVQADV